MLIIIFRRILSNSPWRRLRKGVFLEGPTAAALSIPTSQVWSLVGRPTKSCSPEIHRNCDTATVLCLTLEVIGLGHRESSQAWLKHVEMHRNIETKKNKTATRAEEVRLIHIYNMDRCHVDLCVRAPCPCPMPLDPYHVFISSLIP